MRIKILTSLAFRPHKYWGFPQWSEVSRKNVKITVRATKMHIYSRLHFYSLVFQKLFYRRKKLFSLRGNIFSLEGKKYFYNYPAKISKASNLLHIYARATLLRLPMYQDHVLHPRKQRCKLCRHQCDILFC